MKFEQVANYIFAIGAVVAPWAVTAACVTYVLRQTVPWIF